MWFFLVYLIILSYNWMLYTLSLIILRVRIEIMLLMNDDRWREASVGHLIV